MEVELDKLGKGMGQIRVIVFLHNLTELLAQERINELPDGLDDLVRWFYNQFEVMLGFLTYYEETDVGKRMANEIWRLVTVSENVVDRFYKITYRRPYVIKIDDIGTLKGDIEGIIQKIGGIMLDCGGSARSGNSKGRFEYDSAREKAIQLLNQSLPRTTKGWVADPETNFLVDFTECCDILVDRVINEESPEQLDVIAIQGLHNKGTNTLLNKFYNDARIVEHFETRAWVLVRPIQHNLRNLLLSILQNIMMEDITPKEIYDEMEVWELERELVKQLIGCRYLIVLEWVSNDVVSHVEWHEKKDAFPKNNKGSRVILATSEVFDDFPASSRDIVLTSDYEHLSYSVIQQCHSFFLKLQETEDYWNLFSKMIFGEKECPDELELLGRRIIECCKVWPYIIVMIACILRIGENTVSRWSNMVAQVEERPEDSIQYANMGRALIICYQEMPQHLKMCFLYLCVFPKNTEIFVKQLIQMWIAEGLIPWVEINTNDPNNQTRSSMEDVAEKYYLEGLIGLNFIKVTSRRSDGGPKSCRIREKIWDFCSFLLLMNNGGNPHFDSPPFDFFGPRRRLSVLKNCEQLLLEVATNLYDTASESNTPFNYLRSFSCFSEDTKTISEEYWEFFFTLSDLLRVLNLGEESVGKLPKAIERLFHLRYLRVKPTKNIAVPTSIFNLQNLQTIDLRTSRFSELPKGIWWMRQLRHLYLNGDGPSRLPIPESEDCSLPNLQTLSYISIDADDGINISEKAPNLRKLGLYGYHCFSMSEQEATFNLPHLQKLKFAGECNFEVPITFPDTITKISTGKGIHLQQNVIKMFGKLSNLRILKLIQTTFDDGELIFEEGSFPQLRLLKFEASNVVTWRLEVRAMSNLHHLIIKKCPQLTKPPVELWNVKTLEKLDLSWASTEFANKIPNHLKNKLVVNFPLSSRSGA